MTVAELIAHLETLPAESVVVLRDLNGLDWFLDADLVVGEGDSVVVNSVGVNLVSRSFLAG